MQLRVYSSLLLLFLTFNIYSQTLFINEVMSSNSSTIADEDGEYSDWIELYNAGTSQVSLNNFFLSDQDTNLQRWRFGDTEIGPKEFLLLFASGKDRQMETSYWNTVIDRRDDWNYIIPDSQPVQNWNTLEFNDENWQVGQTGIGYGDDDDETIIEPTISLYARKSFTVENLDNIISALLHIDFDDAFVAYLNGVEIARENIGTEGIQPAFDELADDDGFEARIFQGGFPERYEIENLKSILTEGENVLAVQVHNLDEGSSDMSFIPFFSLLHASQTNISPPPPILQLPGNMAHTNFRINSSGEKIILSDSNGNIIDSIFSGRLTTNVSRGRQPDGGNDWYYFAEATPGAGNDTEGSDTLIVLSDLSFSHEGGFYNENVSLSIESDVENSKIYYTRNGSIPDENSFEYTRPLVIDKTVAIRAVAIHESGIKSDVTTHTYFIDESRPLPVISISTSWNDFERIYDSQDSEAAINIEMFERSGELAFNHGAGAEVFGSGSSGFPQKSLAIFFRNIYGTGTLNYKLFPELPFDRFESFVLRNGGNDWWSTMFRDAMVSNGFMEGTAIDYQEYRPADVYVNGEYWGIHNIREKVNEHYISDHHFISEDNLDLLQYKEVIDPEIIHGDREHYNAMIDYLIENTLMNQDNYKYIESIIDIDNFIDYQIAEIYCANIDWPANNNKFWRARDAGGKWRWILFDTDTGFGLWDEWWADGTTGYLLDHFAHATNPGEEGSTEGGWPNPGWSTYIFRRLLANDEFKNKFINRFADYLNTRFSSQNALNTVSRFENGIKAAMPAHVERWGQYREDNDREVAKVKTFARRRPEFIKEQMISHFELDGIVRITVKREPAESGIIKLNSMMLDHNSWQGEYFQGAPVSLSATPAPGYRFVQWLGATESGSTIFVDPKEGLEITAVFERDSVAGTILVNEINYSSNNDFNPGDWIELYNNNFDDMNISNWKLMDDTDTNVFVLPEGTILESGDYLIIVRDSSDFSKVFPKVTNFIGSMDIGLKSEGDAVRLFDSENNLIDAVAYLPDDPWPNEPNGNGPTLELTNPSFDNSNPDSWASSKILGTPGEINSTFRFSREDSSGSIVPHAPLEGKIQNYPNPFSSSTSFDYKTTLEANVNISVYNILGEKVITLVDRNHIPGIYTIHWYGKNSGGYNLPSGIYLYVLTINYEIAETKKMVKVK